MEELEMIRSNARSFSGLIPPNNAKLVGQSNINGNTYYYYADNKGNYWYDTESGREFEKALQEKQKSIRSFRHRKRMTKI